MTVSVYLCSMCEAGFVDAAGLQAHWNHFNRLHKVDPEIDVHDVAPWTIAKIEVGGEYEYLPLRAREPFYHPITASGWARLKVFEIIPENGEVPAHLRYEVRASTCRHTSVDEPGLIELTDFVRNVWPCSVGSYEDAARRYAAERYLGMPNGDATHTLPNGPEDNDPRFDRELLLLAIHETRRLRAELQAAGLLDAKRGRR